MKASDIRLNMLLSTLLVEIAGKASLLSFFSAKNYLMIFKSAFAKRAFTKKLIATRIYYLLFDLHLTPRGKHSRQVTKVKTKTEYRNLTN